MANIVNGKLDSFLYDGESVNIGNGYKIQAQFKENNGEFTTLDELNDYDVLSELSYLPEGVTFRRLNTRNGEIAFVLDNANKMLDDFGTPDEKREETIEKYFQEAKDYFLERFSYVEPKLVIIAPDGEEIVPYTDSEHTVLRSDDKEAILSEQNIDLKFIEKNLVTILNNHYENEIEKAEEVISAAKSKRDKVRQNDFHFGDDKAPSGPEM